MQKSNIKNQNDILKLKNIAKRYLNFDFYILIFNLKHGYAALTTTLLTVIVSLTIIGGLTFFSFQEVNANRAYIRSKESRYISEAGIEDAAYRIIAGKQITSGETLNVGKGTTTITLNTTSDKLIVRSEGKQDKFQQNLEAEIDLITNGLNFPYGVQVGKGGLEMMNNSRVEGNVYSNGSIIGTSGAAITGNASAAGGTLPALDESWETQNADFSVGTQEGSAVAVVDGQGDVGSYNSLALGTDGLPRISYYDTTNKNLKYARCTNADCTDKIITTVDDTGDVDSNYTSLALGGDGYARISYYDGRNKDLKLARCLNNNCTLKNITLVDGAGDVGQFSSLTLSPDGYVLIAYYSVTGKDLKYARCLDDDCLTKNISTLDSTGDVGKYTSLALGTDGLPRVAYRDETNRSLKLARCANADCIGVVLTMVDGTGDVGSLQNSMAFNSLGLARISYFNTTDNNLKLARCLNADCTARTIITVDSGGNVGKYSSLQIGSDDFPRLSYYRDGDLGFAQCTNDDCSASILSSPDTAGDTGHHTSLAIGLDGLARISYYDKTNGDLRFIRCADAECSPPSGNPQADAAESFQLSSTNTLRRISLFIKKVGNPPDLSIKIAADSGGNPSSSVIVSGTLPASLLDASYKWVDVYFALNPALSADTTYWILADTSGVDNNNSYLWGLDGNSGYIKGGAKFSDGWPSGGWTNISGDFNFRVYVGGSDTKIDTAAVGGNANAHTMQNLTVGGNANGFILDTGTVTGDIHVSSLSNCTVSGNAFYNNASACTILGSQTSPTNPPADPSLLPLPITDSIIEGWKNEAAQGGICAPPECESDGDFNPSACSVSLGPQKIDGDMELDASCSGGQVLTVTGTVWVTGDINISNNARIQLSSSYGQYSGVIFAGGTIHLSNNGVFSGSGTPGSYLMLLSTASGGGHHGSAIDLHNNASGAIFYAQNGLVYLHQNVMVTELVGYKVHLENNAEITYDAGLANILFSAGPSGGYDIKYWKEVE